MSYVNKMKRLKILIMWAKNHNQLKEEEWAHF